MGGLLAKAKKPIRDFNLERRLEAALDAPKNKKPVQRQIDPESELYKKNEQLIGRVNMTKMKESVQSTTHDVPNPDSRPKLSREPVVDPEFGYYNIDIDKIPPGRTTLPRLIELLTAIAPPSVSGAPPAVSKQASLAAQRSAKKLNVVSQNQEAVESAEVTLTQEKISALSEEFKLKPEHIESIATRYKLFDLHVPSPKSTTVKRMQLLSEQLRMGNVTSMQLDDEGSKQVPKFPTKEPVVQVEAGDSKSKAQKQISTSSQ